MGCRKLTYYTTIELETKPFLKALTYKKTLKGACNKSLFGFNGKEKDDEWDNVTGSKLDFGARIYDARIAKFLSLDPDAKNYPSISNYTFVKNNPILRIDPTGKWDVVVHAYNDRKKFGYGVAILKNRNGEEVARYVVRLNGQHHDRMTKNGDTPTGVYEIDDNYTWQTGGSEASYGPNARLRLEGNHTGEIAESGREYIRIHGGRQAEGDWKQEPNEPLQKTQGCIRAYDDDILDMKTLTEQLEANDSEEAPGTVTVVNDLKEYGGRYYTPDDYKAIQNHINSSTNVTGGLINAKSKKEMKQVLNSNTSNYQRGVNSADRSSGIGSDKKTIE